MLVGDLTCVICKLTRDEARTELELVEDLSAETVRLAVGGNRLTARRKLDNGIVITVLVVDRLRSTACRRDHLSRHPSFAVVDIPNGIHNGFSGYDLTGKHDIRLGGTNDSTVLVCIIILLLRRHVNRADDISVAVVALICLSYSKSHILQKSVGKNKTFLIVVGILL